MRIWVDADACPVVVKDIILSAALKRSINVVFVANKYLALPSSTLIAFVKVDNGPDAADLYIKDHAQALDLVITQDILLAHTLVCQQIIVIDPRGKKFTQDNIGQTVATRNLMQGLRDTGEITGGPKQYGEKEKRAFASAFDQEITRLLKKRT